MSDEKEIQSIENNCGTCLLCMPQAELKGDCVCAGLYYGKVLTDDELDNFTCEDYEPYPDFLLQ